MQCLLFCAVWKRYHKTLSHRTEFVGENIIIFWLLYYVSDSIKINIRTQWPFRYTDASASKQFFLWNRLLHNWSCLPRISHFGSLRSFFSTKCILVDLSGQWFSIGQQLWSAFPSWVLIVVKNWLNDSIKANYRLLSIYAHKTLLHSLTCTTVLPRENKPYLNRLNVKFSMDGMGKFKAVPDIIVYHWLEGVQFLGISLRNNWYGHLKLCCIQYQ